MLSRSPFGGPWTEKKLVALEKYLRSWMQILKHRPFRRMYVDAFAGSGTLEWATQAVEGDELLLTVELKEEIQFEKDFSLGSAYRALKVDPPFDEYILVDADATKTAQLELLEHQYPERNITIVRDDANGAVQDLCGRGDGYWAEHRAVVFLDPFGMQVEWKTMQAIANTRAIDLWILFPLGQAVNRLLTRDGTMPEAWKARLNLVFGTSEWFQEFYRPSRQGDLFDQSPRFEKSANMKQIADYYRERLGSIFAGVSPNPAALTNSRGNPIFMLYFAVSNPNAVKPALKIANYLLDDIRRKD